MFWVKPPTLRILESFELRTSRVWGLRGEELRALIIRIGFPLKGSIRASIRDL